MTSKIKIGSIIIVISFIIVSITSLQTTYAEEEPNKIPLRTYKLDLSLDGFYSIVRKVLEESKYGITEDDTIKKKLCAYGEPYKPNFLSMKKERKKITITINQIGSNYFQLFVEFKILEYWPANKKWTIKTKQVEVIDDKISFGKVCSEKVSQYYIKPENNLDNLGELYGK